MFQIRLFIALLLTVAFLPKTLMSQYPSSDSGQYVILSAQYGTARRHVDVTSRLKELARQDRVFRMGNSTFGTDPDPGQEKSLRIYARGQSGQERMFEYREGSAVDGSQFSSWGSGNWGNEPWSGRWEGGYRGDRDDRYRGNREGGYRGDDDRDSGQYVILSAQYGTARRHVDVTSRLKELARQDRVFRMGNSTFGVDPDRGRVKTLRLYARGSNGQERMFEYREGSTVDGSQFRGWGSGNWGNEPWSGRWEGGYRGDRDDRYRGNREGGYRGDDDRDSGQYVILNAQYGTARRHVDVTSRLKELARRDRVFRMGNGTFGVDPDRGRVKTLRIYARGPNGRERMFEYREGSAVDGSWFSSWASGDWGNERWSGRWEGQERDR